MVVLVTCRNDENQSKMERTRVLTIFLPLQVYGNFSRGARTANSTDPGLILPNFEPIHYVLAELVTCKNEDDPIKKMTL